MANILIVDDAVDITQILGFVLKKLGHTVIAAADGAEALAKSKGVNVPVAFLDFNLPDITGPQLGMELRKELPGIKIILLSGQEGVDVAQLGVDAFIRKQSINSIG